MAASLVPATPIRCGDCVFFCNESAHFEAAFPGLSAMSSGHASVRAHDGICERHGRLFSYSDRCGEFRPREVQADRIEDSRALIELRGPARRAGRAGWTELEL